MRVRFLLGSQTDSDGSPIVVAHGEKMLNSQLVTVRLDRNGMVMLRDAIERRLAEDEA